MNDREIEKRIRKLKEDSICYFDKEDESVWKGFPSKDQKDYPWWDDMQIFDEKNMQIKSPNIKRAGNLINAWNKLNNQEREDYMKLSNEQKEKWKEEHE